MSGNMDNNFKNKQFKYLRKKFNEINFRKKYIHSKHHITFRESGVVNSVQCLSYGLDDRSSIPARGRDFSFRYLIHTDSGPAQHPIHCIPGALSPGLKRPKRKADYSPPCSAKVKNVPHNVMAWCLTKNRNNFLRIFGRIRIQFWGRSISTTNWEWTSNLVRIRTDL
jgi:hypothetical protein